MKSGFSLLGIRLIDEKTLPWQEFGESHFRNIQTAYPMVTRPSTSFSFFDVNAPLYIRCKVELIFPPVRL